MISPLTTRERELNVDMEDDMVAGNNKEQTPLDREYQALDPEQREFVDDMCDRYESIMRDVGIDDKKILDGFRTLTKGTTIFTLRGQLEEAKDELDNYRLPQE